MKKILPFLVTVFVAFLFAVLASGFLTHRKMTPVFLSSLADGIAPDGWMEDGATLTLPDLHSRGNFLEVTWNPWRPAGVAPAEMEVFVCGEQNAKFTVGAAPTQIPLKGVCEPRQVTFKVLNPFTPGAQDQRRLGSQFKVMQVSSKFGVAILAWDKLALSFAASLLLLLPLAAAFSPGFLAYAVPALCGAIFTGIIYQSGVGPDKIFPLWLFFTFGSFGLWVASQSGESEKKTIEKTGGTELDVRTDSSGKPILSDPPISRRFFRFAFFAILALAISIRFYGINFGLPSNYHPDEVPKVNAIERMTQSGTLNPDYFLHPSFLLYSTYGMSNLFGILGVDMPVRDRTFLAGRTVSFVAGSLSILLLYLIGKRLFSKPIGLLGALLLAVSPLHVTCSRYLKEDSLLTFFILLTTLTVISSVQDKRPKLMLLAGFLAGMTAGTKYSGMLIGATVFAAPWYASRKLIPDLTYLLWSVAGLLLMPLGFLATTPYALLNSAKFLKDFGSESKHMSTGHTQSIDAWSQLWMYHFSRSIIPGMHLVVSALAVAGMALLLWKRRVEGLIVVGLALLFYLPAEFVKAKPAPQPERYILPCVPFLALCASAIFYELTRKSPRYIVACCALLLVLLPGIRTWKLASEVKNDTRDQMAVWMNQHLAPGSTVMIDWKPYAPKLSPERYNIEYVHRANIIPNLDIKNLKTSGADYLILSSLFYDRYLSQPESEPHLRQRIREVFQRVPIVKDFKPENGTYGFHNPRLTLFSLNLQDFAKLEEELLLRKEGKIEMTSNEVMAKLR